MRFSFLIATTETAAMRTPPGNCHWRAIYILPVSPCLFITNVYMIITNIALTVAMFRSATADAAHRRDVDDRRSERRSQKFRTIFLSIPIRATAFDWRFFLPIGC